MQEKISTNFKTAGHNDIRAEELIISIYKFKIELQEKGIQASRIIMPMEYYRKIETYHLSLGEVQGKFGDYITKDEIFGIPVYIDQIDEIIVE